MNTLYLCILTCFFIGCNNSKHERPENLGKTAADAATNTQSSYGLQADTLTGTTTTSPDRKFIRTADIKFRTKDVTRTTEEVEDLSRKHNGFVTHTHLHSEILNTQTIPLSADSLLQSKEYVVENTMTIRVPNTQLDTLLYEIHRLADFVDFRIVKADDISLQVLENTLKVKRAADAQKRYTKAIDENSKKLKENIQAEENLLSIQNEADSRTVSNMAFMDKVNYSTISLNFYQPTTFKYERLLNHQNIKAFEPALLTKLREAFAMGWIIFEETLLFLTRIWALLVFGIIGIWLYKRYAIRVLGKL